MRQPNTAIQRERHPQPTIVDAHKSLAIVQCDSRYYLYEIFMPYVFKMSIAIH